MTRLRPTLVVLVGTKVVLPRPGAGKLLEPLSFNGAGVMGTEPFTAAQQLFCRSALQVAAAAPD